MLHSMLKQREHAPEHVEQLLPRFDRLLHDLQPSAQLALRHGQRRKEHEHVSVDAAWEREDAGCLEVG